MFDLRRAGPEVSRSRDKIGGVIFPSIREIEKQSLWLDAAYFGRPFFIAVCQMRAPSLPSKVAHTSAGLKVTGKRACGQRCNTRPTPTAHGQTAQC